jgi:hypothetical protein
MVRCKLSILAIVANGEAVKSKRSQPADSKWSKPGPREVKLNVDPLFFEELHAGSVGVVLRDYEGKFVVARTSYLPHVISAQVAEALAMKEGLSLPNEMGIL